MAAHAFSVEALAAKHDVARAALAVGAPPPRAADAFEVVAVGLEARGGERVVVYVEGPVGRALPRGLAGLPPAVRGIPVTVRVLPPPRARRVAPANRGMKTQRPVRPGCSVGPWVQDGPAGTLGAIVERGGKRYILSNNHVLAFENALPAGTEILQAAPRDGGEHPADVIATLADVLPLDPAGVNLLDAALAELRDPALASAQPLGIALSTSTPRAAQEGDAVRFVGRTSGARDATVASTSGAATIRLSRLGGLQFDGLLVLQGDPAEPLAEEGDSGSLVIHRDTGAPVGLLVSAGYATARAIPITPILDALGAAIVV